MRQTRTDLLIAIALLIFCTIMIIDSYGIRDLGFGGLPADAWPRFILWLLAIISTIFLANSNYKLWQTRTVKEEYTPDPLGYRRYLNALYCFGLFSVFLYTLDYFGMLIGATGFTFLLLNILGGISPKKLVNHALISIISIGGMWAIFTFGLKVILPEGELIRIW